MAEPFIGEIRMFGFNFAPAYWATCDGQTLQIQQNQALYSLLGTMYGGNGTTTFCLPDLRGRTIMHKSNSYSQGYMAGQEQVNLGVANLPAHQHTLNATTEPATESSPENRSLGTPQTNYPSYSDLSSQAVLNQASLATAGSGASHSNMQPSLAINFCIALQGIYPSRN